MRLAFFSIPALSSHGVVAGKSLTSDPVAELNRFLGAHRVATIEKQLVPEPGGAYWAICVSYLPSKPPTSLKKGRVDYKELLSEEQFKVYARLRDLRKEIAEGEGVPAYAVFTNEQLAAMVTSPARTQADLAALSGVGPARVKKYGERFLSRLEQAQPQVPKEGGIAEA